MENAFDDELGIDSAQAVLNDNHPSILYFYEKNHEVFEEIKLIQNILKFRIKKDSEWGERLIKYFNIK